MLKEIWKDIPEYIGLYQASNFGRIKSLGKYYTKNVGKYKSKTLTLYSDPKMICQHYDKDGYLNVTLVKDGKPKMFKSHRIIGITFLGIPKDNLVINHKNGIKDDNRVDNIEWVTIKENTIHAHKNGLCGVNGMSKPVACLSETGDVIRTFESARQAELWVGHLGHSSNISKICRKGYGRCAGYKWTYL